MAEFEVNEGMFAYDVLYMVRNEIDSLRAASNVPGYDALDRIAGPIACLKYGHPDQPKPYQKRKMRRHRQAPWRCDRCRTWWVAVLDVDGGLDPRWKWDRVDHEIPDTEGTD